MGGWLEMFFSRCGQPIPGHGVPAWRRSHESTHEKRHIHPRVGIILYG